MATRASDRVTLATLPSPSYVRLYYVLQESTLSPPAQPTTNPPAAPWSTVEPPYTAGSTMTLYTSMLTAYGSVTHEWGPVQVSSSYEAAKQAYNLAYMNSRTIDGMRRLVASITEPPLPADGWMNGDQWWQYEVEPVTGRNRLSNIWIWNGLDWAAFQLVADSVLVPSSIGNVLLAEGAVDAMTIRGAQIYGGYIEAPVIASSDKLGSGANVLNDPGFTSTVNTAWVASGHLGDTASRSQVDTISWDRTWTQSEWDAAAGPYGGLVNRTMRNYGSVVATAVLAPNTARQTGTILFPNISWFNTAARSVSNPQAFVNKAWLQVQPNQMGGDMDPSFSAAPAMAAILAGTARTTYLTNSATIPVVLGERWNATIAFTRVTEAFLPRITEAAVEVINASSSAVLWSHVLSPEELLVGRVNAWWESAFNGNVKYRVKFTYTAGGAADFVRRPGAGNYARQSKNGVLQSGSWERGASSILQYGGRPGSLAVGSFMTSPNSAMVSRVALTSAQFSKVEPTKGWRLTEDGGLELFSSLGAKTGQLDGQSNFLAGRFASASSGARAQMSSGAAFEVINNFDSVVGGMRIKPDGSGIELFGEMRHVLDTEWAQASAIYYTNAIQLKNTWTNNVNANWDGLQSRRRMGIVYITGAIWKASNYASLEVVATLPPALRPAVPTMVPAAYATTGGYVLVRTNGDIVTAQSGTSGQIALAGSLVV